MTTQAQIKAANGNKRLKVTMMITGADKVEHVNSVTYLDPGNPDNLFSAYVHNDARIIIEEEVPAEIANPQPADVGPGPDGPAPEASTEETAEG